MVQIFDALKQVMSLERSRKFIVLSVLAVLVTFVVFIGFSAVSFMMSPQKNIQVSSTSNATGVKATQPTQGHTHAAFMVFVDGKAVDFSGNEYQNKDLLTHFENGDGVTLHNHSRKAWLGMFLQTVNMTLANNCLTLDNGSSYCSDFDNQISFVVNGKANSQFQHYVPKDGDRILISYGNPDKIDAEIGILNSTTISRT